MSPYGIPKVEGGESPANVGKMERCVAHVLQQKGVRDKGHAIAICKASLGFTKGQGR